MGFEVFGVLSIMTTMSIMQRRKYYNIPGGGDYVPLTDPIGRWTTGVM
jgi:hypothetical protein